MTDHDISVPGQVPAFLRATVPELARTPEFQRLDVDEREVPGLLIGQVAILTRRLQSEVMSGIATRESSKLLEAIYSAIERLSMAQAASVRNLVVVEFLEHLHGSDALRDTILENAGSATRGLYRIWVEPNLDKG